MMQLLNIKPDNLVICTRKLFLYVYTCNKKYHYVEYNEFSTAINENN